MATIEGDLCPCYSSTVGVKLRVTYTTSTSAGTATVTVTKFECIGVGGQTVNHSNTYSLSVGGTSVCSGSGSSGGTVSSYTIWSGSKAISKTQAAGGSVTFAVSASDAFMYNGSSKTATISKNITVSNVPAKTYTVSYNANGGSGAPSSQTKTHGVTLTLSSTKPTKASTTESTNSTITIKYNTNGGSTAPSNSTGTRVKKVVTTYAFSKWNTAKAGTGTNYNAGGSYTANAAATLYAQYTGTEGSPTYTNPSITLTSTTPTHSATTSDTTGTITVTYNANGGSGAPSNSTGTYTDRTTTTYTFSKWNSNSAGTGTNYNGGTAYTFSASATLYAKYTTKDTTARYSNPSITLSGTKPTKTATTEDTQGTLTITYNANGGTDAPSASTGNYVDRTTTTYTFSKWNSKADGTGTNYNSSTAYTFSANTTIYAQYTSNSSTARYSNPSITIPSEEPTRDGFIFAGWAEDPSAIVPDYEPGDIEEFSQTQILYAVWQQISKSYIGVDDKAQKIVTSYIGVNGKAEKIIKAYIGINGKAQPLNL